MRRSTDELGRAVYHNTGRPALCGAGRVARVHLRYPILFSLISRSFYSRDAMLTGVLAMALSLSVFLTQLGVLSKRLQEWSWVFPCRLFSTSTTLCFKEIQMCAKNKGTSLRKFVLNSGLRKFRHGISSFEACYRQRWTPRACETGPSSVVVYHSDRQALFAAQFRRAG